MTGAEWVLVAMGMFFIPTFGLITAALISQNRTIEYGIVTSVMNWLYALCWVAGTVIAVGAIVSHFFL